MIDKREWVITTFGISHPVASMALAVLTLAASSAVLPSEAEAQGGQNGQALFQKRCTGCHALDADHEGPRPRGVVGRAAGTVKNFHYFETPHDAKQPRGA